MKTSKLRVLFITGIAALGSIAGLTGTGMAQTASVSETVINFPKEKSDISRDANNIMLQREKIDALKQKCKEAGDLKDAKAEAAFMADIRKESADLAMYKAYLRADKMELIDNHNIAISKHKNEIKNDKALLKATRKQLDKNLDEGNDAAASKSASWVAHYQKELEKDEALLREQRITKNNDIIAVNGIIKNSDGQYAAILRAENTVAATKTGWKNNPLKDL